MFGICVILLCISCAYGQERPITATLSTSNGGRFGVWGTREFCPAGTFAHAFRQKIHRPCGVFCDDTANNAVELLCSDPKNPGTVQAAVHSTEGHMGSYMAPNECPRNSYIVGFRNDVEPYKGALTDDTKGNNINVRCRDINTGSVTEVTGKSPCPWGSSQQWSRQCPGASAVCGITTKVEPRVAGDNTALNDLHLFCCPLNS